MDQLRRLQLTQLEILKAVDNFCKDNNIKYSLYAGTLLGAVRHKGFIPWDDDLDICMPRLDYQRFIELWKKNPIEGYFLQNHDIEPNFPQTFSKIRKEKTTYLTEYDIGKHYRTGIFIDVFPVDRIRPGYINKRLYWFKCMEYQLLVHNFVPENSNFIIRLASSVLLKCYSGSRKEKKIKALEKRISKDDVMENYPLVLTETITSMKKLYPAHLFENIIQLDFEDGKFMAFKDWDAKLSRDFGDYMTPPPIEERVQIHEPLILDFDEERYI